MHLEERIAQLEHENRKLRWGVLAASALGIAALFASQSVGVRAQSKLAPPKPPVAKEAPPKVSLRVLTAQRFVLEDLHGHPRAVLEVDKSGGSPALNFLDADGKVRASFGLNEFGSLLSLRDSHGDGTVRLRVASDGPHVTLADGLGFTRAEIGVTEANGANFALHDVGGRGGAALEVTNNDTALTLTDAQEKMRSRLAFAGDVTSFNLDDANGQTRVAYGVSGEGPALSLNDASGNVRVGLFATGNMPRLDLYGSGQQTRVSLSTDPSGTRLSLQDDQGFRTVIGSTNLVTPSTGETRHTSAAGIHMFNKDGDVMWVAP